MVRHSYSKKNSSRRPKKRTRRVKNRRGQCGGVNELVECPVCFEDFDKDAMLSFHNYFFDMGDRHCICAGCMAVILGQPVNRECPLCRLAYNNNSYTCNVPSTVVAAVGRAFAKLIPIRRSATTGQYPTYSTVGILLFLSPIILHKILLLYMSESNSSNSAVAYMISLTIMVFYPNVYNNLIYWIESKLGLRGGKRGKSKTGKSKTGKSKKGGASDVMTMTGFTEPAQEKSDSSVGYKFLYLTSDKLNYLFEYILKNREEFDKIISENNSTEPLYMLLEFPKVEYAPENIKKYSGMVDVLNAQILEQSQNISEIA